MIKAAPINTFILTTGKMTLCNVKGVRGCDEPTDLSPDSKALRSSTGAF